MRLERDDTGGIAHFDRIAVAFLAVLFVAVYFHLPRQGDMWWPDTPRHALNGAFMLDFIRQMPLHHPTAFAYDYYRQWPALTILFYPPLFYVSLLPFYLVFGVSEASALMAETVWFFLLALGAFRLSRRWLGPAGALAVALVTVGTPQTFYWGQQVLLDIPGYAILVWAAKYALDYMDTDARRPLIVAAVLGVLAVWMKYNAAWFLLAMALAIVWVRGFKVLRERAIWQAALVGLVLLVPVLVLFHKFGTYDLQQAYTPRTKGPGLLTALTFYGAAMPKILSWPVVLLAALYVPLAAFVPRYRIDRASAVLLGIWLVLGYLFYSSVSLKEFRIALAIYFPMAVAAVLVVERSLSNLPWRGYVPLGLAAALMAFSFATVPAPYVTGMREAAQTIARVAPKQTNTAFWGRFDGTFVFGMRAYGNRPDMGIVRMDKILFRDAAVSLELGYKNNQMTDDQLYEMLKSLHVQYIVYQDGYLADDPSVRQLGALLATSRFREVTDIAMTSDYPFSYITHLHVYRMVEDVPQGRVSPQIQIKLLGISI
jgi:Dolichyl-phosphate-mannose-protein mannosyltransferase